MKNGTVAFFAGVILTAALFVIFGARLWRLAAAASATAESHEVTYTDFLTVTLTALCALLAAMTIAIAIAAFIGYHDIQASAERIATDKAEKAASKTAESLIAEWTPRFTAVEREMRQKASLQQSLSQDLFKLLSGESASSTEEPKSSRAKQNSPKKSVQRYPRKENK